MKQGVVQDLLGCEVVAEKEGSNVVYGIVRSFAKWIFLSNLDDKIECDEFNTLNSEADERPKSGDLRIIVGRICSMLQ